MFEGEYKYGREWNGKGNIIRNKVGDKIEFEGELIYGLKNGKLKIYNENNILIFEGQYLNGKRNGKIEEFS